MCSDNNGDVIIRTALLRAMFVWNLQPARAFRAIDDAIGFWSFRSAWQWSTAAVFAPRGCGNLFSDSSSVRPRSGARDTADAEMKVPSGENQELQKGLLFKAWSRPQ